MSVNDIKIMLIGETGVGKSQLGNFLLQKECFKVGINNKSETDRISEFSSNLEDMKVTIIDTPGLNDTFSRDEENMNLIVEKFQNDISIDGMILVYSFKTPRKVPKHEELLKNLITIFGKDLLESRLKVIFTNCTVGIERDNEEEHKEEIQKKDTKEFLLNMVKEDDMIFVNSKMSLYKYFQKNILDLFKNFLEIKRKHGSIKSALIKKKELEFIEKQKEEAERKRKELEKQKEEEERKRKELEKQKEEEERKRKEEERKRKELEKQKEEEERKRKEEERKRKEMEKQKEEEERKRKEMEKQKEEEERKRKEVEKQKEEEERKRKEVEKQKEEEERKRKEMEKQKEEEERKRKEMEKQKEEEERKRKEEERKRKEVEKQKEEEERKRKELEKQKEEAERKQNELEKNNIQINYKDIADKISEYRTKISDAKQRIEKLKFNKSGAIAGTVLTSIMIPFTLGFSGFGIAMSNAERKKINCQISNLEKDISYYTREINKLEEIQDNLFRKLK